MGSRANKQNVPTYERKTTVSQDIKEAGQRGGRLIGGLAGRVRDTVKAPARKARIDKAIEDAGG
jgi:hypothetical protein